MMRQTILKVAIRWRRFLLTCHYGLAALASLALAYQMRFDFDVEAQFRFQFSQTVLWIVPLKVVLLAIFGQFHSLLSYFSIPDLKRTVYASISASGIILLCWVITDAKGAPPRGVILADLVMFLGAIAGSRLLFRLIRERYLGAHGQRRTVRKRVGIIGAADVGASLARELMMKPGLGLQPVMFFDDNPALWNSRVHNLPVAGRPELLAEERLRNQLDEIIIAMPDASVRRVREVVQLLHAAHLKFETVPSLHQLATGAVKVSQLRPVEIQDLLGRAPIQLETGLIGEFIAGQTVLVTGAGGSIGSELCRQIAAFGPRKLLLLDRSEPQLFCIEQELIETGHGAMVVAIVADILHGPRIEEIFRQFAPNVVFHAAAHKHVPMMESQPAEAIRNNAFGTAHLIKCAITHNVDRFLLISTDKAINPTSVMGASKRLAEIFLQSIHSAQDGTTKLMAVRFGNVLGSSGSVVPVFTRQIAAGGPVKVTHPDVTRYFMTIPEAASLVLQSATQGEGGEIFVLDMGEPVKIVDLARQMIELSGLRAGEDIEIAFTGLRPGEKLFEELSHKAENTVPTHHPKIMRFTAQPLPFDVVQPFFEMLSTRLHSVQSDELRGMLHSIIPEYCPSSGQPRDPATEGGLIPPVLSGAHLDTSFTSSDQPIAIG